MSHERDQELLDIVNDQDEVTGQATRSVAHGDKLTHRIVHVLVSNDKAEIALQLRSATVEFEPHAWISSAAGHVASGETYELAAQREMVEELGVTAPLKFLAKDFYGDRARGNLFLMIFIATHNGPFAPQTEDVERIEFFSLEKIRNMIAAGEKIHTELLFILQKHFLK